MEDDKILYHIEACLRGKATDDQLLELKEWLERDVENQEKYEQFCRLYYRLNYVEAWDEIKPEEAFEKMERRLKRRRYIRWGYYGAGIAALIVIMFNTILWWNPAQIQSEAPQGVEQVVKSGERKAVLTLASGEKVALSDEKVTMDLGSVIAEGDSLAGLIYRRSDSIIPVAEEYNVLTVPRAGEYILTLSDGTKVWLNAESELKYPVLFTEKERKVYVSGEAYFDVAKDMERPFIVYTDQTETVVYGTAFNVKAYREEENTEVTLVRGSICVGAGGRRETVCPGEQACIDRNTLQLRIRKVNVSSYTSWKDGLFDFDRMTLEELAVPLSRWYDVDFMFVQPEAGKKRFTGAVKRNNSLRFMLDFVEKTSDVYFEVKGKTVFVYN